MPNPVSAPRAKPKQATIPGWYLLVAALAAVWVLVFIAFYFRFDLPRKDTLNRTQVLYSADEFLAELVAPKAGPGEKVGWSYLPQRLSLIWASGLMLLASWSVGRLTLRSLKLFQSLTSVENLVFATGLGMSVWSLVVLGCGLAGWMSRSVHVGLIAAATLIEVACLFRFRGIRSAILSEPPLTTGNMSFWRGVTLAACMPFLFCIVFGGLLPQVDFDTLEYHFGGPKEWFQTGRITFLPHNVYTSFPFLTEMFSLEGMILKQDWYWGAVSGNGALLWFQPLTALTLYAAGKRWYSEPAGLLAAWVYLTIPWIFRLSNIPYVEGGLLFYVIASLYATWLTWETVGDASAENPRRKSFAMLAGLLAGSAMACKYPGVLSVVIPMGVFMLVGRRMSRWMKGGDRSSTVAVHDQQAWPGVKAALTFSLGVAVTVGPWLAKNLAQTGNPVYPLLYKVFSNSRDWDAELDLKFKRGHSPKHHDLSRIIVANRRNLLTTNEDLVEVVVKHDWQSPLLFALAPLALLSSFGRRRTIVLWGLFGYLFLTWWIFTHRIDRFWLPILPIAALLAGVGGTWVLGGAATAGSLGQVARRGWVAFLIAVCGSMGAFVLAYVSSGLCGYNPFFRDLDQVASTAAQQFSPQLVLLNERLPPGSKVLCVGEAKIFEARFPLVYNTVFDKSIFEEWCGQMESGTNSATRPLRPAADIRKKLAEEGITHVFVNWLEVLRYRTTYSYTDFVTPRRFLDLQKQGVLGPAWKTPTAYGEWGTIERPGEPIEFKPNRQYREQIETWGPELHKRFPDGEAFVTYEVFPVLQP